jgi:hypothetical protein
MMNAGMVMDSADHLATMLLGKTQDSSGRVTLAYERALGRSPTDSESTRAVAFVNDMTSSALTDAAGVESKAEDRAWSMFCQGLFASNEFIYLR